jgi:hypothetical protein
MRLLPAILLAWVPLASAAPGPPTPRSAFEASSYDTPRGRIDEWIQAALGKEHLAPAPPCSDAVFIRRVFLDLIGTLPTADEVRDFLDDRSSGKRAKLVEQLFLREEFADFWAMRWCDMLRVKAEFPINLWPNPAQAYHRLLRTAVKNRLPLDRLARSLLTATGSNMRVPESNFFRAVQSREPKALAGAASLAFMGVRQEAWSAAELDALATCFSRLSYKSTSEWKEEIIYFDLNKPAPAKPVTMPDGKQLEFPPDTDPRAIFAAWLLQPGNPWFARNFANRAWFWMFGRGLVHEPDDFRRGNPPSHPELLAYLAKELTTHDYDFRHVLRLIANSRTYQQSPVPAASHPRNAALFASFPVRQLEAEVLIDALCAVTGTTESYTSLIPEPFTFLPDGTRAIEIPDGSISSSFLELFGRPARDSGLAAERNPNPSSAQRLHFLNSSHVRNKLERSVLLRDLAGGRFMPNNAVAGLYLTLLSRRPTAGETALFRDTLATASNRRDALIDLVWALLNTTEFQCHH